MIMREIILLNTDATIIYSTERPLYFTSWYNPSMQQASKMLLVTVPKVSKGQLWERHQAATFLQPALWGSSRELEFASVRYASDPDRHHHMLN